MEGEKVINKTKKVALKSRKKREVTAFYDSDEEISWGKVSVKEVKAKLTGNQNFKPVERYSTPCLIDIGVSRINPKENKPNENIEDSIPEVSEYLTASEQTNTKNNSTDTADYSSSIEPNTSGKYSVYLLTSDDFEKCNDIGAEDTCLNFIQKALDMTVDNLENENQILVETTVNYCNESTSSSSSVILISSDDEDELEFPDNVDIKKDNLSDYVEVSDQKISSSSEKDYSRDEETYDIPSFYIENSKNIDYFKTDTSQNESILSRNISPATYIPDISLENFNDSTGSVLNNTLDKINAILAQEENASPNKSESDSEEDNMSMSYETNNKWFSEPKTTTENYNTPAKSYKTPIKTPPTSKCIKITPTNTKFKPTTPKSNIPILKKSPEFRMPQLPNKLKVPNKSKCNIKDIVSPVRMYIKYSPKPVLKQSGHSVEKPLSKLNLSPRVFEGKNKENLTELPNVCYKPSKKQILVSEESIHFPGSLDKMIKKSAVIKHEWHPRNKTNSQRNETLNPEAELTKSFLSDCSISEDNNISILHKRTALRD